MKLGAVGSVATDVPSLVLVYEEPAGTVVSGGEWKSRETGLGFSSVSTTKSFPRPVGFRQTAVAPAIRFCTDAAVLTTK